MKSYLIIGASRGLGSALALGLPRRGDRVWAVARTQPSFLQRDDGVARRWVEADLAAPDAPDRIADALGVLPLDVLVYNAGVWEGEGFAAAGDAEIRRIIDVNLTSLLLVTRRLRGNLIAAPSARVVLIGSTCGLENEGSSGAGYVASKFGVRGAAHALREWLRPNNIPVTCLSPGSMATDVDYDLGPEEALRRHGGERMPVHDIVRLIACILNLSPAACVKELHVPALRDTDV